MQGFNPLQAAQQMGLGMAGSMKQMNTGFQTMPGSMAPPPPIPQGIPATEKNNNSN